MASKRCRAPPTASPDFSISTRLDPTMTYQFQYQVTPEATEIRLKGSNGAVSTDSWAIEAPTSLLSGVDLTQRLIAAGAEIEKEDAVNIEHGAISGFSAREAKSLSLPPIADVVAHLETTGIVTRPDFRVKLHWR